MWKKFAGACAERGYGTFSDYQRQFASAGLALQPMAAACTNSQREQ